MEQADRRVVLRRKEILDQEYAEIQEKLQVIAKTLSEFSHNLSRRPKHIVIAEISPAQTIYLGNQIYFNRYQFKQAFNLELIENYIISLQHKGRESEVLAKVLND
jgi:menaquinone-dependent protoporphyrinogen IX oxidase